MPSPVWNADAPGDLNRIQTNAAALVASLARAVSRSGKARWSAALARLATSAAALVWIRLRSPGASAFQTGLGMRMSAGRVESGHHPKTVGCLRSVRADVLGVQCVRLQRLWQRLSLPELLEALGDNLLVLRIGQLDEILSCQLQVGDDGRPPHQDLVSQRLLNELVLADVVMLGDQTRQLPQFRAA